MNSTRLARKLGTADAVFIGLGSMIGAGIFAAFGPAAAAAGPGLLLGLAVAAAVAFCNATSSAQLAAVYPESGGTYVYGRRRLGEWPGFLAGWCFVIGKTASCAAMALTFAAYAVPQAWQRPVAAAAVAALVATNYFGVTRTAGLTRVIVVFVLAVLALVAAAGVAVAAAGTTAPGAPAPDAPGLGGPGADLFAGGAYGTLQAAALLFFAFAGYARIATMGEEVRDPARTIPRAIVGALAGVLVVYLAMAVTALATVGAGRLAGSAAPLALVVEQAGWDWASPVVRAGAAAASLGALLALVAGVGRTSLAMAREADLPRFLAAVHPRHRVPHRAELLLGAVVVAFVLLTDLRGAIGFSSFGVLLYYLVANVSAFTQPAADRRYPRWLQVVGAAGCVVLVATLPPASVAAGLVVVGVGAAYRAVRLRASR